MKKARKLLCLAMAAAMTIAAMAGCTGAPASSAAASGADAEKSEAAAGSEAADTPDIDLSKEVELSMYLIGSTSAAYDKAVAEMNTKLKEDMNTTVKVSFIGWGDFSTKYPLVLASGEPIDLIYASGWCNFTTQAQKGAFMPLEELAPKYAPKSYAELSEDFIDQATIDGHMYGFPPTFFQYNCMGYIVRGDLMKKYGMTEIKNMEDYGKYLENVVKNDPQLDPSGFMTTSDGLTTAYTEELGWYNISQNNQIPFYLDFDAENPQVFNVYDTPEMSDFFVKMKEWGDKGYWPKSVLSNKDEDMMVNGKAASRIHGLDSWKGIVMKHPEYEAQWYPLRTYSYTTEAMQDGMAIPASSKNPERAMMFLEKLRQEQEYYNYLTYGIEGETYNITADNQLEPLDLENFAPENFCSWGFKSLNFYKEPVGTPKELKEYNEELSTICVENIYQAFKLDTSVIKNEVASLGNVVQQYAIPLAYGYVDDPAVGYKTLLEKLKAAGSDKVKAEIQTQLDAYLAAKKK